MTGPMVVRVPGSKSIANRALVIAALAEGESELRNVPGGDDTVAMVGGLRALGIAIESDRSDVVTVVGGSGALRSGAGVRLDAGLAGTTSRFLTALAALGHHPIVVDGDPPLRTRPMGVLHMALSSLGAIITYGDQRGRLPIEVLGPISGGTVSLPGDVSSQFITALMLVGPTLPGGLRIELTTPLVSRPYVTLTAEVMASFGVGPVDVDAHTVVVPEGRYAATVYDIEPDASSASYPLAVAAVRGTSVTVAGMRLPMAQGDGAIVTLLEAMGCSVSSDDDGTTVSRSPTTPLVGIDVDMADISDLVPTVAAAAVTASTPTTIRGVGFIRAKESDRLGDLAAELAKAGARIVDTDDGLHIEPVPAGTLHGARLLTHHDHRLAMAFAVLSTVVEDIDIDDRAVVSKSWPDFWETYRTLL